MEVLATLEASAESVAEGIGGRTRATLVTEAAVITGEVSEAAGKARACANLVRDYADAIAVTQQRLTVVAAIADRDMSAAAVMTATSGDTTTMIGAEHAAATVLAAVAGELDDRTRELADHAVAQAGNDSGQPSGSTAAPMVPGAMMGAVGPALAAAGARMHDGDVRFSDDVTAADLAMLRGRAAQLAAVQPPEVAPWVRLAVGLGQDPDGHRVVVIGTSEPAGYLRPGTAPEPHDVVVGDGRPPELVIVDYFHEQELLPIAVCATTPPASDVRDQLAEAGVATSSGADEATGHDGGQ
jgi:hypothetical protein